MTSAPTRTSSAVVGTAAPDEDAVAAIKVGSGICTGTLVGPRILATARHCVVVPATGALLPVADLGVTFDDVVDPLGPLLAVESIRTFDDGPFSEATGTAFALDLNGRDLAALILTDEVADVSPRELFRGEPVDLLGTDLTLVGYGLSAANATGAPHVRRSATFHIELVSGVLLEGHDPILCGGDSGGPGLLADGRVIGVSSIGAVDALCGDEDAVAGRLGGVLNGVWADVALFDDAAVGNSTCLRGMPELCDALDNDCDGEVDEACDIDTPPPPGCSGTGIGAPFAVLALLGARRGRRRRRHAGRLTAAASLAMVVVGCAPTDEEDALNDAGPEGEQSLAELLPDEILGRADCAPGETEYLGFVTRSRDNPNATPLGLLVPERIGFLRYETIYTPMLGCDCGFPHAVELFVAPQGRPPEEPTILRRIEVPRGPCNAVRDVILALDPPLDVGEGEDLFVLRHFESNDDVPAAAGVCWRGCQAEPPIPAVTYYSPDTDAPYRWTPLGGNAEVATFVRLRVHGYPPQSR